MCSRAWWESGSMCWPQAALGKSLSGEARLQLKPHRGAGSAARELPYWSPSEIAAVVAAGAVLPGVVVPATRGAGVVGGPARGGSVTG